jgi:tRNA U34 5-methylaminomethyl-2-thiouridine-forming methyltransferase MnmC
MKDFEKVVRQTSDGSYTIFIPDLDENYHSFHGAIQESQHVFINQGLNQFDNKNLDVFEVGFGTGLNALLTCRVAERKGLNINYTSIEAYPLDTNLVETYISNFENQLDFELIKKMHLVEWGSGNQFLENFNFRKVKSELQLFEVNKESFDIIYYDAFGPRVQPEMWTCELFSKMFEMLRNNGLLVTYCAKGQVKRDLKKVGFEVETCQGPPGKREMIRAWKR